jgi:hypothetical protein
MQFDNPRLRQLLLMLSSDQAGEVSAAAKAIGRLLAANGADWHELAARLTAPQRGAIDISDLGHADRCEWLLDHATLNEWERGFLRSLRDRRYLTKKQRSVLNRIAERETRDAA